MQKKTNLKPVLETVLITNSDFSFKHRKYPKLCFIAFLGTHNAPKGCVDQPIARRFNFWI